MDILPGSFVPRPNDLLPGYGGGRAGDPGFEDRTSGSGVHGGTHPTGVPSRKAASWRETHTTDPTMHLFLVQHGRATSKAENPDRPLTAEGRREIDAVMFLMMRYGAITANRVLHSGKLRAAETARAIAGTLDVEVASTDGLAPMDDPAVWIDRLASEDQDLMLVGHLPHLSRLASALLCDDPEAGVVDFVNAGVVCLRRDSSDREEGRADGRWSVNWSIPPSLVR